MKYLIIVLTIISNLALPQIYLVQESNCKDFEGFKGFQSEFNYRVNNFYNWKDVFRMKLHYDKTELKRIVVTIYKSKFDYMISKRLSNDFAISDQSAYQIFLLNTETFNIYSPLCSRMSFDPEEIFSNIVYINSIKDKCMVGNGVRVAVDNYGITTNVYLVYYEGKEYEGTEVETKNIWEIPFTFYTIDEKFVQFLYANSK